MAAIGWHVNSSGGHRGALGEYMQRLDAAGIPFAINAVNDAGLAVQAASYTNAPHTVVFRETEWSAAPDYNLSPEAAAQSRWEGIKALLPPEIPAIKGRTWIEPTNEPDRHLGDWVGRFMYHIARLMNQDGYRCAGPSWATGNPEQDAWETPGMLQYLSYCAANPDKAAVAVHEYSLDPSNLKTGSPWLIGRIVFLYDVCEEYGIPLPTTLITECGWDHRHLPANGVMEQIEWLHNHYRQYPQVKGVNAWTLGSGAEWGDLPQKLSAYVEPVTEYMLQHGTPVEPEEPMDIEQWLWEQSKAYQKKKGVDVHHEHGLEAIVEQMILNEPGWVLGHNETTFTADDGAKYGVMAIEHITGKRPRTMLWFKRPWGGPGGVKLVTDPEHDELAREFRSPVGTIAERESGVIWPGDWVDANPYLTRYILGSGYSRHTGADLNLNKPHWDADKGAAVHAIGNGVVTYAEKVPTGTWGRLIVIRHETPEGKAYHSRYGHLGSMLVQAGQHVRMGDVIGTIGGAEFGLPNHLHFDVSHSGILESNPRHWPGDSVSGVTNNYLDPKVFLGGKVDGGDNEPPLPTIDLLPYLRGDGRLYEVRNAKGSQERFQTQADGNVFYQTKNHHWEMLYYDDQYIYRDIDTSPGGGRFYRLLENGQPGSRWIPRHWRVGEQYTRSRRVQFYDKATCKPVAENSGNVTDTMRFVAYHAQYTFRTGITLPDVVELEWSGGEKYLYARDFGLVAWERSHQDPDTPQWSAISEVHAPGTRPGNTREVVSCL